MSGFSDLKLIPPILKAVLAEGYLSPTPIQLKTIPIVLARQDLMGCAQTGTGKTAAFALPILQLLSEGSSNAPRTSPRHIRCLVLTPTRELASQIADSFSAYGRELPIRGAVIYGGVGQRSQVSAIRNGVDIVVATPGRLLDLMQQRLVSFNHLEIFVLDEADRMLDMGFINDVRRIIAAIPKKRQTLFFSATMPSEINRLADQILTRPTRIEITPAATTVDLIAQSLYQVDSNKKTSLLVHLLSDPLVTRSLVFTRTKRDANRVAEALSASGIRAEAIHGNKSQNAREAALANIKIGRTRVLVATDIAARGIDIDSVTHVYNYDIPNVPESYVHRIGRTARAGLSGVAIAFCSPSERPFFSDIERLIRKKITILPLPSGLTVESKSFGRSARGGGGGGRGPRSGGSGSGHGHGGGPGGSRGNPQGRRR